MATLRPRGKSYYMDIRIKGKRIVRSLGRNRRYAELELKDIELKKERGERLGIYDGPQVLFRDFVQEYLGYSQTNKAPTSYSRDVIIVAHLVQAFGDTLLSEITPAQVEHYKEQRLQSVKPPTVNREVACLKHMFSYALHMGKIEGHPIRRVKLFKESPGRLRYLTEEEVERLLRECNGTLYSIVVTALNTGMRKSELLDLRWEDIDFTNGTITLRKTKNNELGIIPINETLMRELRLLDLKKRSAYVFPNTEGNREGNLRRAFVKAVKRACIKDFRFHDLRHSFGSHLVMQGVDIRTVQVLMRHKDIKMTLRYTHVSPGYQRTAINRLHFGYNLVTPEGLEKVEAPKSLIYNGR